MQIRKVDEIADKADIGLSGIKIIINRQENLVGRGLFGHASANGKVITLYPDAFRSEETLVKTLAHERTHVYQVETFGQVQNTSQLGQFEAAAKSAEEDAWQHYLGNK